MSSTISELRASIARGDTTHEAVISQVLDRAALPSAQHVFTQKFAQAALAAARYADGALKAGVVLPPLAGLPVSVKDLFDVAGEPTLAGSVVCKNDAAPLADAEAVSRLRRQGAAIIGKTNMTEFAFSGVGINPHYGTPRNPADLQLARIPGGSSSGAAVSVALGLAVAGLGSDTGGSIRIPAALCGLVGFKSTQSRVPSTGSFELARTLDTVCAMARSVEDCLEVDAVLSGAPLDVRPRSVKGIRLAVPETLMFDDIEPAVARAFDKALQRLSAGGALIERISFKELAEVKQLNAPGGFSAVEAYSVHRERLAKHRDAFDQRVAQRIEGGSVASAADYIHMLDARRNWIARTRTILARYDALACPTVPIVAPEIEPLISSDEAFFKVNGLLLRNTFAINFMDGCSFSLPCHDAGELPVGLMLSASGGDDSRLASVALAVEAALRS